MSPASILVAAPAARAIAILRARAAGAVVRDAPLLEALTPIDTVCFAEGEVQPSRAAVDGLRARGVRAVRPPRPTRAARRAPSTISSAPARACSWSPPGGTPRRSRRPTPSSPLGSGIAVAEGRLDALPGLVDLGRALRRVLRQNAALGAVYNAAVIPAAALGHVPPLAAAGLGAAGDAPRARQRGPAAQLVAATRAKSSPVSTPSTRLSSTASTRRARVAWA